MSRPQSFIGAYARNRRATNQSTPSSEAQPQNAVEAMPETELSPTANPPAQAPPQVSGVDDWIHSVVVAGVVPEGNFWRIDSPSANEMPELEMPELELPASPADSAGASTVEAPDDLGDQMSVDQVDADSPTAPITELPTPTANGFEPLSEKLALEAFGDQGAPPATEELPSSNGPAVQTQDSMSATISARLERLTRKVSEAVQPELQWRGADWEVDAFEIPRSVAELFFDEQLFRSIAEQMEKSVRTGLESVLVTSVQKGEGRSTVAIGMAIAAAATGLNVAIVDTSIPKPSLIDQFALDVSQGWPDALRTGNRLETVSVVSLEDGVTLVPFDEENVGSLTALDLDQLLDAINNAFDLVLFDTPTIDSWITHKIASATDSSLLVRDMRRTSASEVELAADRLRRMGVRGVGVIENFCGK